MAVQLPGPDSCLRRPIGSATSQAGSQSLCIDRAGMGRVSPLRPIHEHAEGTRITHRDAAAFRSGYGICLDDTTLGSPSSPCQNAVYRSG